MVNYTVKQPSAFKKTRLTATTKYALNMITELHLFHIREITKLQREQSYYAYVRSAAVA